MRIDRLRAEAIRSDGPLMTSAHTKAEKAGETPFAAACGGAVLVVNLDGVAGQPFLRSEVASGHACEIDAVDLAPRLRIIASRKAAGELRRRLKEVWPSGPALVFYGSGDFHHLSALFLGLAREPVTVIHFDNHPDWVTFPKTLNCGSWVNRALELACVEKIVTIGIASDDLVSPERKFANLQAIREGALEVHAWRARPSRLRGKPVEGPGCRAEDGRIVWREVAETGLAALIEDLDGRLPLTPLWITLDKDVLGPAEAVTNWDQSALVLDDILAAIAKLADRRRILGVDVCGDYSRPRYRDPFRFLLSALDHPRRRRPAMAELAVNDRTNARIAASILPLLARRASPPAAAEAP